MIDHEKTGRIVEAVERQERIDSMWEKIVPHAIGMARAAAPAIILFTLSAFHHSSETEETVHKVNTTYETLAPATNDHADEIKALKQTVAAQADSIQVLQALVLAGRQGFNAEGEAVPAAAIAHRKRPARRAPPPADPVLIEKLTKAEKAQKAAAVALKADKAPPATVPTTLPPDPPKAPEPQRPPVQADAPGGRHG